MTTTDKPSMNQIFQKYVKPHSQSANMNSWLDYMKNAHSDYVEKGGHLELEPYALKRSVAMNNRVSVKNVEGEKPVDKPEAGKMADTSFWARNKRAIAWTAILVPAAFVAYQLFKEAK